MATEASSLTKGERTRQHLLEVAERVFGEKGFHVASVADITREAGVANGTFYVHFPSKKDLFVELVRTRGHEMRAEISQATEGLRRRFDIERAGAIAFLEWVRDHPNIYRIVKNAEFVDTEVFREWYERMAERYTRALAQAMEDGEICRAHAEALAYSLMAIYDFVGMRWTLWEKGTAPPAEVLDTVFTFVARGLGIEDQPPA